MEMKRLFDRKGTYLADAFLIYKNLTVPRRLIVRPVDRSGLNANGPDLDFGIEALRWFDYWLKGIKNGIMNEAPIHYYRMGVPVDAAWQTATGLPLKKQKTTPFYFEKGKMGSIASINDGFLTKVFPSDSIDKDSYTLDYTTTSGKNSRWVAVMKPHEYPDMSSNDKKTLTYTTPQLDADVEITGHPIVILWLKTEATDFDVFAYLEEVDRSGKSTYITEGGLRATHRKKGWAPYNNFDLPFYTHFQEDLIPIPPQKPIELAFSLLPTSYKFKKGNRIRITIAFADTDNFETPTIHPAPNLELLRDAIHPSRIRLPSME
jgi:uncharacterized protein